MISPRTYLYTLDLLFEIILLFNENNSYKQKFQKSKSKKLFYLAMSIPILEFRLCLLLLCVHTYIGQIDTCG